MFWLDQLLISKETSKVRGGKLVLAGSFEPAGTSSMSVMRIQNTSNKVSSIDVTDGGGGGGAGRGGGSASTGLNHATKIRARIVREIDFLSILDAPSLNSVKLKVLFRVNHLYKDEYILGRKK